MLVGTGLGRGLSCPQMKCALRSRLSALQGFAFSRLWLTLLVVGAAGWGAAGCAGIGELGEAGSSPTLSPSEQSAVRGQVSQAISARRWKVAWNQEIEAGADRTRLQDIALQALADRSRHAGDMLAALRERYGALSAAARAQVDNLVSRAKEEGRWTRAMELELLSADDPPSFSRAWALYQGAPVELAPGLLEAIQEAREDLED